MTGSTDAAGRLLSDETPTSVDDERVMAAGDSAVPSDMPFRMSACAAGCLGAHAADTCSAGSRTWFTGGKRQELLRAKHDGNQASAERAVRPVGRIARTAVH